MLFERPGATELKGDVDDLNERIEELKKLVALKEKEVTEKLKKAEEYQQLGDDLNDWLKEKEKEADEALPVDDLTHEELQKKADKAKKLKKDLEERQKDKDRLKELSDDLTSNLSDDNPDKQEVKQPCQSITSRWDDLAKRLEEAEPKLENLRAVAKDHESDYSALTDWLGPMNDKVAAMATVPSDLDSIQEQLKAVVELEKEVCDHQPQFKSCCDSGGTLSNACEDPGKKEEMDQKVDDLQEKWRDLHDNLNKAKEKLERAAEGGEKLEGIVGEVLGWIDGVHQKIQDLGPIGVRTGLIDEQIAEQKTLMDDVQAHAGSVKTAQEVGQQMLADLEGKEKEKMQARLKGLTGRFSDLDDILNHRMEELEETRGKAEDFESKGTGVDEWLTDKEKVLNDWEVLPVDSAALEQHMDKIGDFDQEVAKYYPTVVDLMQTEGGLLGADPETIISYESDRPASSEDKPKVRFNEKKKKKKSDKEALPDFMKRPGAQEVIDEVADLRKRYEELKKRSTGKVDELADLLAKVQKYETDHEQFCDWLNDKKREIEDFGPIPVTPEEVEKELKRVQDLRDEFEGKEPPLEDITNLGSQLVDYSGPTTSSEALKVRLSDTNHTWDDLLDALDKREEGLKGGKEKAVDYQDNLKDLTKWLKEVEEKLDEPERTSGDPQVIARQCADTKDIVADIDDHKPDIDRLVKKAEELEKSRNLKEGSLGEKEVEERFKSAEEKAKERADKLDDTLKNVLKVDNDLSELIEALEDIHHPLSIHDPVRVTVEDIERQLTELEELKKKHDDLQPRVEAVVAAAEVFAVPPAEGEDTNDIASSGSSALSDYITPVGGAEGKDKKQKQSGEQEDVDHPSKKKKKRSGKKKSDKNVSPKGKMHAEDKDDKPSVGLSPSKKVGQSGGRSSPLVAPAVPSGAFLHGQLAKVKELNNGNDSSLGEWLDKTNQGLGLAKKFEEDYDGLYQWILEKKGELDKVGPVGATEEKIKEQIKRVEELQATLEEKKPSLKAVNDLGGELCREAIPPDVDYIHEELEKLNSSFSALEDGMEQRKDSLRKGCELSDAYKKARDEADEAIAAKKEEVARLPLVGTDIETVQAQIEECKSLENEVNALKEKLSSAHDKGRKLMGVCSDEDAQAIEGELQDLAAQWNELNAAVYERQHKLEEALLNLGQFHDALAELLLWISNEMAELSSPTPPGVEEDTISKKMQDLEAVKLELAAREDSVASVNEAAGKLVSSSSSGDTSDLQKDIEDLNKKWKDLNVLCADREKELKVALEKAKTFHGNRNRELDWLDDIEKKLNEVDRVHGLPDPCAVDIAEFEGLKAEIEGRVGPIKDLVAEGDELKPQGNSAEQRQVEDWVGAVQQRYEDLLTAFDDRKHQLDRALSQAEEFDEMYNKLMEWLEEVEKKQGNMEPIHSDLDAVQQQLEDNKELQKDLDEHEAQIDEAVGCGSLLCRECVPEDSEVIQKKIEELQARWDLANTSANDRQSSLEEALLALGQFEDAYDELMKWLNDAEEQLDNPEPVTGNPDAVGIQLGKHKTFQKQLGARNASLKSVTKAGDMLMKQKDEEDAKILQEKLDQINNKWEAVCSKSVNRQQKLQDTYKKLGEFRSAVGPLRTWLAKMLPHLNEGSPVHGDVGTVNILMAEHEQFKDGLLAEADKFKAANECGEDLVNNYLDDPEVTQRDLDELTEKWNEACQLADNKQARLDEALQMANSFEDQHDALLDWITEKMDYLKSQSPPAESPDKLDAQIKEQKELVAELNAKQADLDAALDCGREIMDLAHPKAIPPMESKLHDLDMKWSKLKAAAGERSEELSSALLEMKGLQEMLDHLTEWVTGAEAWLGEKEMEPVSEGDLEAIVQQLAEHERFQEEMEAHQPDMDALSKAEKGHKGKGVKSSNDLDKKIRSLHKRWQKLGMNMHQRHRLLKEAKDRCNDMEKMKNFDFETWRKKFNKWVDKNKLRPRDLLRKADGNRDGNLTKDEFMAALKASGLPTNPVELNRVAIVLDPERIGVYNIDQVLDVLRPEKVKPKKEPKTDSEKIAVEIDRQVSLCTCERKFKVSKVGEGKYRFGDSQQLRLVRILRSTVMVRVGGGWDPLDVFLKKHDPCRATGRTNIELQQEFLKQTGTKPGLAMTGFRTSTQSALKAKRSTAQDKDPLPKSVSQLRATDSSNAVLSPPRRGEVMREKSEMLKPRLAAAKRQGTPERTGIPTHKTPPRATPSKHSLPRKSPRRETGGASVGTAVTHSPTQTTVKERPLSSELLDVQLEGEELKGKVRTSIERTTEEKGKKTTTTTFRASKSPSPKTEGSEKKTTTPGSKERQSRIPTHGSKIPTPGKGKSGTK